LRLFSSGTSKLVISGNPGIGKSWFGFFVLHHLATQEPGARIVWESSRQLVRFYFHAGTVVEGNLSSFTDVLRDWAAWFIVDEAVAGSPVDVFAQTLLLSSPRRENYKELLKCVGATIRFMPVWTWSEIQECHALLYSDDPARPVEAVQLAYDRWGGIPRFVLEKLPDPAAQLSLQEALSTADIDSVLRAVGQIDAAGSASHRLLHIVTARPYVEKLISTCSRYVADQLAEKFATIQRDRLLSFLSTEKMPSLLSGLRGDLFEPYAHTVLRAGGTFTVRRLDCVSSAEELELPTSTLRSVRSVVDLASCSAGDYCQPTGRNFPAVDAVLLPSLLFQMTVSLSHSINRSALKSALAQLPVEDFYDFYFVVPENSFLTFRAQPYVDSSGKVLKDSDASVECVRQWALCLPLEKSLIRHDAVSQR
jgi:hypothetical protein